MVNFFIPIRVYLLFISVILAIAFFRTVMIHIENIAIATSQDTGQHINNIPILRWSGRMNIIHRSRRPHMPISESTADIEEYTMPLSAAVSTSCMPQRKYGRPVTIIRIMP